MPLGRQNIPFVLTQGIDNKTSDKLYQGQLKQADNIRIQKNGIIQKRYGVQSLGNTDAQGNTLSEFSKLGEFNSELLAYSNGNIYSYAENADKWFDKGGRTAVTLTRENVFRNANSQSLADLAINQNTTLIAWEDDRFSGSGNEIRVSVIDNDTGHSFISDLQIDPGVAGNRPRCLSIANYLVVFWVNASDELKMRSINILNPSGFDTAVKIGDTNATQLYDVTNRSTTVGVVVHSTVGGATLRYAHILTNSLRVATIGDGLANATTFASQNPTSALNCYNDAANKTWVFYYNSTGGLRYQILNTNFLTHLVDTQISSSTIDDIYGGVAIFETTANNFKIIYDRDNATSINYRIQSAEVDDVGTITSADNEIVRSVSLVSKGFNSDYFIAAYQSTVGNFQDTYFVMNTAGVVISRFSSTIAGGHLAKAGHNASVYNSSGNKYDTVTQIKTKFIKDEGTFFSQTGLDRVIIEFTQAGTIFEQIGQNTYLSGGLISGYDGQRVVEDNFHVYPENIQLVEQAGGNLTATNSYQYIVLYQWLDAQGQRHQSTTSLPATFLLTGGNQTIQLTIPMLRLTDKPDVTIEIYRTAGNGTIFYRVTTINSTVNNDNDVTTDTLIYVDDVSDASIQDNEILYTTGGVLENSPPPAAQAIASFQNRSWLGALEEPNKIRYSKELVTGRAIEFSDFLELTIDPKGGRVKALEVLDDKLIIFKEATLFAITGVGPSATGQGGNYSAQLITSDVGTIEAETIVSTELGLMFKSRKGIYLLDRGLNVSYIGAKVEDFNSLTMTGSTLIEDANEVRFVHSNGVCLVYNYYFQQWYTFSNYEAKHSLNLESTFYKINNDDGIVDKEVSGYYGDRMTPIIMTIETGWFSFAGINGFKRVYEFQTVGNYDSNNHSAKISISYDFKDAIREEFNWTPGINLVYGEESPYGSEVYGGGINDGVWYYRFKPSIQKCTSIKLKIQDRYPESNLSEGFELTGITFEIGNKGTSRKPNNGLTVASSQ